MRRHIDLFSGIGGFSLAAHWAGFTTEVFCERDPFCQKVLNKHWPTVPIVSDIHEFDGARYHGSELLTGGFPCQPYSVAGQQLGNDDDRALWPQMLRVIRECQPRFVVGENVAGIINMALDGVLSDLENEGYATQAFVIPACAVNAPHKRDRVWIVGYAEHDGSSTTAQRGSVTETSDDDTRRQNEARQSTGAGERQHDAAVADADSAGLERRERQGVPERAHQWAVGPCGPHGPCHAPNADRQSQNGATEPRGERGRGQFEQRLGNVAHGLPARMAGHFDAEPDIPRTAVGIPQRAAKLKALGNSIVPEVAYQILRHLGAAP